MFCVEFEKASTRLMRKTRKKCKKIFGSIFCRQQAKLYLNIRINCILIFGAATMPTFGFLTPLLLPAYHNFNRFVASSLFLLTFDICSQWRSKKFKKRGAIIFTFHSSVFFSAEQIRSRLKNRKMFRGVRGHAPRKFFKNLRAVMAILALFE